MGTSTEILTTFFGKLTITGIPYTVQSCFASDAYDLYADRLLKTASIAFVVDPKNKIVFIKTSNTCEVNAGKLAAKLFEGGGVSRMGIGKLNETLIKLSKTFTEGNK